MMWQVDPIWDRDQNFVFNPIVKFTLRMAAYENDNKKNSA